MTEYPDTAAFRLALAADTLSVGDVDELLDALDSTRAKHDQASTRAVSAEIGQAHFRALWEGDRARAKAAEARLERLLSAPSRKGLERRAEAAEARIAELESTLDRVVDELNVGYGGGPYGAWAKGAQKVQERVAHALKICWVEGEGWVHDER